MQIRLGSDDDGVIKYPDWQRPVQEALVEIDKEKLKSRLRGYPGIEERNDESGSSDRRHWVLHDAYSVINIKPRSSAFELFRRGSMGRAPSRARRATERYQ